MKKLFVIFLAAVSLTAIAQQVKVGDIIDVDDINYKVLSLDPAVMEVTESPFAAGDIEIMGELTHYGVKYAVKSIGKFAFFNGTDENTAITAVTFHEGLEEIGVQAFIGCNRIKTIHFPSTLKSIGSSAFYCYQGKESILSSVTCDAVVPPTCGDMVWGSRFNAHDGNDRNIPLNVPKGSVQAYRNAKGWEYFNIITDGEETSTVEEIYYDPETGEPISGGEGGEQAIDAVNSVKENCTKRFTNGNLIIERNGIKYSAQGQKIK